MLDLTARSQGFSIISLTNKMRMTTKTQEIIEVNRMWQNRWAVKNGIIQHVPAEEIKMDNWEAKCPEQ